ncbi:hypothetical protein F8388_011991 [Cannabis sativa]|uniref:Uncharacterized protein n=1 Tax=Cannabis sativa TaxID=3483 RepID=A0A7J6GG19_CANSA|nr:hypothetical protein F8388_011991 [Cannabis sativa]
MFEPMFKPTLPPSLNKAGKSARQVQIRECFPQPLKERLDEGREMQWGKENAFGDRDFIYFSSKTKKAEEGPRKKAGVSLPLEFDNVSNRIVGLESKTFPRFVGGEVTLHVPGHYPNWASVPEQYEHLILSKIRYYYEIDRHPKVLAISLAEMAEKYKTRKNVRYVHFKEFYKNPEDFEIAVKNPPSPPPPPNELNEEQWRLICQFFTSEEFTSRSKQNALNQQKMLFPSTQGSITIAETLHENQNISRIENWKACHTKKGTDEFVSEHAKEKCVRMKTINDGQSTHAECGQDVEIEILRETLGERRGHKLGVGRKLKGQSGKRRSQFAATTEQLGLSQTVSHLQRHIQAMTRVLTPEQRAHVETLMSDVAPTQPTQPIQPTQPTRPQLSHFYMSGDGSGSSSQPMVAAGSTFISAVVTTAITTASTTP